MVVYTKQSEVIMYEIIFAFPIEKDAHTMHMSVNEFFQGSNLFIDNNIIINPVKKIVSENSKPHWEFAVDFSSGEDNATLDKIKVITGGQLSLMNGDHHVWAFS